MTVAHIDVRELERLRAGLISAGTGYQRANVVLAQSLNRAGQRARTDITNVLRKVTGIRRRKTLADKISPVIARPAMMASGMRVRSPHLVLTRADFGASWSRSWPGAKHSAWGRTVTAKGSFMAFRGGSSHGGGLIFKRTGKARLPIKPLYGPNVAREMERNASQIMPVLVREAAWFNREAVRRARVELARAKAQYGL